MYEDLLDRLQKARERYENVVRDILAEQRKHEQTAAAAITSIGVGKNGKGHNAPGKGRKGSAKGFKYAPGTHWTQTPEGKAKLAKRAKEQHRG